MTGDVLVPFRFYSLSHPLVGVGILVSMLWAAYSYFGLVYEFYKDFKENPFWFTFGLAALCLWGGMACLLTALCYEFRLYTWLLVAYTTNSIVVWFFYNFYKRRKRRTDHDEISAG